MTNEFKDRVLSLLCENIPSEKCLDVTMLLKVIPFDVLYPVLQSFAKRGFVTNVITTHVSIQLVLHLDAIDFFEKGGFAAENSVSELRKAKLQLEVKKLQFEIQKLEDIPLENAERISTILANISAFASAIIGK